MKQYNLCRNRGRGVARAPYLLVLQRDDIALLKTRLVAPVLRLHGEPALAKLFVLLTLEDEELYVSLPEIFSIDCNALGPVTGNASHLHDDIIRGLDMLITG